MARGSKKFGSEAIVKCGYDFVYKKYRNRYFALNKEYKRKGEVYFLNKYRSTHFPEIKKIKKNMVVFPNYGIALGISGPRRKTKVSSEKKLNLIKLIFWLEEVKGTLERLKIEHRDINPSNVLYKEDEDKYTLIDFGWAIEASDPNKSVEVPNTLNPYAKDDKSAIEKMQMEALFLLISKSGTITDFIKKYNIKDEKWKKINTKALDKI